MLQYSTTGIGFVKIATDKLLFSSDTNITYCIYPKIQDFFFLRHHLKKLGLPLYEGKSLNNRNFIITFLQEYLQKWFVSYFST